MLVLTASPLIKERVYVSGISGRVMTCRERLGKVRSKGNAAEALHQQNLLTNGPEVLNRVHFSWAVFQGPTLILFVNMN